MPFEDRIGEIQESRLIFIPGCPFRTRSPKPDQEAAAFKLAEIDGRRRFQAEAHIHLDVHPLGLRGQARDPHKPDRVRRSLHGKIQARIQKLASHGNGHSEVEIVDGKAHGLFIHRIKLIDHAVLVRIPAVRALGAHKAVNVFGPNREDRHVFFGARGVGQGHFPP